MTESIKNQQFTLVTGGTGFIGQELLKLSHPFICATRQQKISTSHPTFHIKNIDENTVWKGAFKKVHSIIHLAGLAHSNEFSECSYQSVNVDGTLKLANEAANAGVKRFIFVSSITVNGPTSGETPFTPSSPPQPYSLYSRSKLNAELGLRKIADRTGLEIVIVRPPLVYGENAPGNFGKLIKLVNRAPLLPFGKVNNKRSFIYVKNLTDFLMACTREENAANQVFLPSDADDISTKHFISLISKGIHRPTLQLPVPQALIKLGLNILKKKDIAQQLLENLETDKAHIKEKIDWIPPTSTAKAMNEIKAYSPIQRA